MARNDYPHPLERREIFLLAWRNLAANASFGGMTAEEFQQATDDMVAVRNEISRAEARLSGLRQTRDIADKAARELMIHVAHGVRGDHNYGEDCPLYRSMGYIPKSERKSGLQRKYKKTAAPKS
jgi:hypothetical protein